MDYGLMHIRRSILASLGVLAACGPTVSLDTSGSAGSGSDDSTADDGVETSVCEGSVPILQSGVPESVSTGWELCPDGVIHRVEAVTCQNPQPTGASCTLEGQSCATDADCTYAPQGRCIQEEELFGDTEFCACRYGCQTDADCESGQVCVCGGTESGFPGSSRCMTSGCTDDASCGDAMCALGSGQDGCGTSYRAACHTPADACRTDAECNDGVDCYPQAEGMWACEDFCCCGRPLLVDGAPVTAAVVARDDWAAPGLVEGRALTPALRGRIAAHFTQAAQLEHASVASFARFGLELMALGAPPELLAAAQRAGQDEVDHARRCFGLARALSGTPVGPGPLPLAGVRPATDLEAVMAAVIDEACVGETLAAVVAHHALVHAVDPAVRRVLEVIAADELRHAQLGWQTLRWALARVDGPTRTRLRARLDTAIERAWAQRPPAVLDHDRAVLRAYGVLDPADRRRAHGDAIAQVLRPCAAALVPARASEPRARAGRA